MEDNRIIELFWARNEDAIAETDATYGRKLRALANKILNNREDAEESVSDTYMKTWEIIPPQRPTYFYAFIASICRHLSFHKVDWKQAAKRNAEVVALTDEMEDDGFEEPILEGDIMEWCPTCKDIEDDIDDIDDDDEELEDEDEEEEKPAPKPASRRKKK